MKNIAKKVEAIRKELKEPLPEPQNKEKDVATKKKSKKGSKKVSKKVAKKKGTKKVAKKGTKKVTKKGAKKADDGSVSLAALAKEAGVSGQKARVTLRKAGIEREAGGQWKWAPKSKALKAARKALGLK